MEETDLTQQAPAASAIVDEQLQPKIKNRPGEPPTAELVADYEALKAKLGGWEQEKAQYVAHFDDLIAGGQGEAKKLHALIGKRLGLFDNGAKPMGGLLPVDPERPKAGTSIPCPMCSKHFKVEGLPMHVKMHARKQTQRNSAKPPVYAGTPAKGETHWCDPCGIAVANKGWAGHQAAHERHGDKLPVAARPYVKKPKNESEIARREREARRPWIWQFMKPLQEHQPIGAADLSEKQGYSRKRGYAVLSALAMAGYVQATLGKYTLTAKGLEALAG